MSIDLQLDADLVSVPHIELHTLEASLAVLARLTGDERLHKDVCVRICTAVASQSLNATYRQQDKPTNVLSFAAGLDGMSGGDEAVGGAIPLGDLAICWPVIESESLAQGKDVLDHFMHIYVHGLLHLLGFDHQTTGQADIMEDLEVRTLTLLGLPNPYGPCNSL